MPELLFCFALQVGLLLLVWQALMDGSATTVATSNSETDKLWMGVGQVQRQVCWLNKHAARNTSVPANAILGCTSEGYDGWRDCLRLVKDFTMHNRKWGRLRVKCENCTKAQDACALSRLGSIQASHRTYIAGLLYPEYMTGPADCAPGDTECHLPPEMPDTADLDMLFGERKLSPAYVNLLTFLALAVYVHHEVARAIWLGYVSALCAGVLPAFYKGAGMPSSTTAVCGACVKVVLLCAPIMQAFTGLMVLVTSMALTFVKETQSSIIAIVLSNVALTFVLDLDNKIGEILAAQGSVANVWPPRASTPSTSTSAHYTGARTSTPGCRATFASPGFGSRVYTHLHNYSDLLSAAIVAAISPAYKKLSFLGPVAHGVLGHCYMACLGLVCFLEAVCMSSKMAWCLCLLVGRKGFVDQLAPGIWFDWAEYGYGVQLERFLMLHIWSRVEQIFAWSNPLGFTPAEYISLGLVYIFAVGLFVFLLHARMVPTPAAKRWGPVLLSLQVLVAVVSSMVGALMGFVVFVAATLGMFVIWPLLHREQPSECCSGCSGCCRPCGGCPLCPSCPGQCCCVC